MAEDRPQPPTEDFETRLRNARHRDEPDEFERRSRISGQGMGLAFRITTEFVAAVAVGVGIGWLLDNWLDTKPWFLILFVLLGAVAGFLNVYRTVTRQQGATENE
jgi:ATP synthase protein I